MLVARACAPPPTGRAKWTLELLDGEMVRLTPHEQISRATIGRRLDENDLKPWQRKMWCIPKVDPEFVARMEDVIDLYTTPPAPGTAVNCPRSPTPQHTETRIDPSEGHAVARLDLATTASPGADSLHRVGR